MDLPNKIAKRWTFYNYRKVMVFKPVPIVQNEHKLFMY